MKWLKQLLSKWVREEPNAARVTLHDPEWTNKQAGMFAAMGAAPPTDPLLGGLIAWQDARLSDLVRDCTNPKLNAEEALSLVHRIAEVQQFREALAHSWQAQREKALGKG